MATPIHGAVDVMKDLLSPHHSIADWDNIGSPVVLSPDHFISPPTSAKIDAGAIALLVCRVGVTLNLPEGRIVSWMRAPSTGYNHLHFRCQSPVGSPAYDNLYYCSFVAGDVANLGKRVAGRGTDIGIWDYAWPFNTWYQVRLTWDILPPTNGNKRMTVKLEARTSGDFVDYGDIIDQDADFENTGIARVGLWIRDQGSYHDDYQVYLRT